MPASYKAISAGAASTTTPGAVELATDTEAKALSSQTLAVTPGNLAAVFAEPPALGGTTPNAVSATVLRAGDGSATAPSLSFTSDTGTGWARLLAGTIGFITAASERARFQAVSGGGRLTILDTGTGGFGLGATFTPDVIVARDAANILAQRNGTAAQAYRVYGTFTDINNRENLTLRGVAAADFEIFPDAVGTGTLRGLRLGTASGKLGFFGATAVTKPAALTAADAATVDATYGTEESGVINNVRTRLNEMETRLKGLGLLT